MAAKLKIFPEAVHLKNALEANTIEEFDNLFTAPQYGYKDAHDYYEHVSANKVIKNIMSPSCYPIEESKGNKNVTLQITRYGGHVGYVQLNKDSYWLEERMYEYIKDLEKQ